jgi:tetratricopeptide (TPR) repeat protein
MHFPNWILPAAIFSLSLAPTGGISDAYTIASRNYAAGNFRTARDQYLSIAKISNHSYQVQYHLANCYLQLKDYANAQEWYSACLENSPDITTMSNTQSALEHISSVRKSALSQNSKGAQQL